MDRKGGGVPNDHHNLDQLLSVGKALLVVVCCVALNLLGVALSRRLDNILFLDLTGTAIASLIYGPIHGALVGFISNGIGEMLGIKYYFLFAFVQATSAAVWGITPRLLQGKGCTDFFNDGVADPTYRYPRLFCGFIWVSLVSHVLACLAIAFLMVIYGRDLSCEVAAASAQSPGKVLCDFADALFSGDRDGFPAFARIASAKFLLGWPDQLIALSMGVLLVANLLPGRRYKMDSPFGRTLVTQRRSGAVLFTIAFVVLSLYRVYFAYYHVGPDTAVLFDLFAFFVYTNVILAVIVFTNYEFDRYVTHIQAHIYPAINADLERAYEDCLKLGAVLAVIIFVAVKLNCTTTACAQLGLLVNPIFGDNKITGLVGVVFVITFIRYLSLITARSFRK